jgi:hypothetical protein
MMDIINALTKIMHLILMIFFLFAIVNSIWSWAVDTFANKKSNTSNQ